MLQSDNAPLGFLRCCLPWEQLGFHKISSVCKTTYTAEHQWDPGILVGIFHVPYMPCFQHVCMYGSSTANTYAYCWKGPHITEIGLVNTCSLLSVSDELFRKAVGHSCKNDHKDSAYCQYVVRHDTSFITLFLPACVVFSMVNQLKRYLSGAQLGFQTNANMQAFDDERRGICVELRFLVGYLYTRMIWSLAWLSNYHSELVHTDCWMIKTSHYKMEEEQKLGGICLHSCSPPSVWLPNNIYMSYLERSHSWKEAQGKCTHLSKFGGVHLSSSASIHLGVCQLQDDFVKSGCVYAVIHHLGVQCCLDIELTWELSGAENMEAQYKKHDGEDIAVVLGHEHNTTVFLVIPKLVLALPGLHWLDLLTVLTPQGMYSVALMPVVTCVEILDAHAQWDPGGFLSTICGDNKSNHLEHAQRLQWIVVEGYTLIIGMNASPAHWDLPIRVKARRTPCRSGSVKLLQPAHAIAWGQAMFCRGGNVTPVILHGPHLGDGLLTWALAQHMEPWIWNDKRERSTGEGIEQLNRVPASRPLLQFLTSCSSFPSPCFC